MHLCRRFRARLLLPTAVTFSAAAAAAARSSCATSEAEMDGAASAVSTQGDRLVLFVCTSNTCRCERGWRACCTGACLQRLPRGSGSPSCVCATHLSRADVQKPDGRSNSQALVCGPLRLRGGAFKRAARVGHPLRRPHRRGQHGRDAARALTAAVPCDRSAHVCMPGRTRLTLSSAR